MDRPSTRDRKRPQSARARLTPAPPPGPAPSQQFASLKSEKIAKETKERVKSAKAIKNKHTSSAGVFVSDMRPPSRSAPSSFKRFTSMYSKDFDGTFVPPAEIRPTSPTRRNNPHPAKQFMVWRVPSREIGAVPYQEGLELPPEYITRNEDFDAIDELSGNLGGLVLPPTQATSTEYGSYLHKNPAFRHTRRQSDPKHKPVSQEILRHVMMQDPGKQYALEDWLKTATPEEQHTILKMFKSAEEAQVHQTIGSVMQPEAAQAVKGWLKGADQKEKEVAVRLFSSLGSRPPRRQRSLSEAGYLNRPPSRKSVGAPTPRSSIQEGVSGLDPSMRTRKMSAPPGPKPWPAGIWHHKPVRDPPPQVYHRGSLFGAVKQDPSHFNIHPDWPDYLGAGDTVH